MKKYLSLLCDLQLNCEVCSNTCVNNNTPCNIFREIYKSSLRDYMKYNK